MPRAFAERSRVCPLALSEPRNGVRTLAVALADPKNIMLIDQLQQLTQCRIKPMRAIEADIRAGRLPEAAAALTEVGASAPNDARV